MRQYRLLINGEIKHGLYNPENWSDLALQAESRGFNAKMEYRDVIDIEPIADGVTTSDLFKDENGAMPAGSMILGSRLITGWEYHAEVINC